MFFIVGIPLPFRQIHFTCIQENKIGKTWWDIFYNDRDPEYPSKFKSWKIEKPNFSFNKMVLVSMKEISSIKVRIIYDFEYEGIRLQTLVKFKPTESKGFYLYYYGVPDLPYDRLTDYP